MDKTLHEVLDSVRPPDPHKKVYKDECMYSFDSPDSETGLYICMKECYGFGKKFVEEYSRKSGNRVFLHLQRRHKIVVKSEEPVKKKPTKLAIDVEGGFDSNETKYTVEEHKLVVVLPEWKVLALSDDQMPPLVVVAVDDILALESATKGAELAAMSNTWEGDVLRPSKHALSLKQLDNGVKVPPSGWQCRYPGCNLTTNLWLNLTDGAILCGRRYHDGSGGNNHAVEYFYQTKYPLAVKLGTITPEGADVYSYDEDDMVLDPLLSQHLAHFGIDIMSLKKTEKTMLELEIDANSKIGEWDVIQESGQELTPLYGPGYTGMRNLGNSCYLNSCVQVLFNIPDFINKYPTQAQHYFSQTELSAAAHSFNFQMAKLGQGLLSGDYSKESDPNSEYAVHNGISPNLFKLVVGQGHHEFSSKKQQDVHEYLLHLFMHVERNSRGKENPLDSLRFKVEERRQCTESKCVSYTDVSDNYILSLPVPMEHAQNTEEVAKYEKLQRELSDQGKHITKPSEIVRPIISLKSCLNAFRAAEMIDDFYSSAAKRKVTVSKCSSIKTFPPYLLLHMRKFTISENWTPKKLDVSLVVPDVLDLTSFKGQGRQTGEDEFPPDDRPDAAATPEVVLDEGVISQLMDMGFGMESCKRAVFHTKNTGAESAMNWIMEHMGDADFADPFVPPGAAASAKSLTPFVADENGLQLLMAMGFSSEQAVRALRATDNNPERATDWIFSHGDDSPSEEMETEETTPTSSQCRDTSGKYRLKAFISHMGTSTDVGHYVCHINKDGRWVIYNDEKVAESKNPPKDLAYVYLYESMD